MENCRTKAAKKHKQTYKAVFDQSPLVMVGDTNAATAKTQDALVKKATDVELVMEGAIGKERG